MNECDQVLPDEIETLRALRDAAAALNGNLVSAGAEWRLRLPGAPVAAVRSTGAVAFPLVLSMPHQRLALPACAEAAEMVDALRAAILGQEVHLAIDLAGQKPTGWEPVSTEPERIELARTTQAAKGWPSTAEVAAACGVAVVEVRQAVTIRQEVTRAAVDHLLAWTWQEAVQMSRRPSCCGAAGSLAEAPDQVVCYRLATPAGTLTASRLAEALRLIGGCYRSVAPALNALAEHTALAEAYLTLNGRQK